MYKAESSQKTPSLFQSFIPIIFLIILLSLNVIIWKDATLDGSNQIALLLAAAVGTIISFRLGADWEKIRKNIVKTIGKAMPAILILLLIGALSGTWLLSGVIPAFIYYGLDILHPSIFLFATVVISSLVSLATGSSWSTIATIGVALLGIGHAMGINDAVTAGAIISGAYFGDKMSPLSDTTNLAPAMAGTDLYTHIRYMMITTVPSMGITLIIFFIIGFSNDYSANAQEIEEVQKAIASTFNVTPWLFIVPAFLIFIIIKKVKPIPSMLLGTLAGGLFGVIFQSDIVMQISGVTDNYAEASYISVMQAMYGDIEINTVNENINDLFGTSGMAGMLNTIWLILSAMVFGGVMESSGMLKKITMSVMKRVKSSGSLIASTAATCIFFNATASDQYISIVVPGRMYNKAFKEKGLKPEVLSRTLEDAGTVTSVLIPWNTGGATQAKVLGVATVDYIPYAFFNLISPLMTVLIAYLNFKIRRIEPEKQIEKSKI
ncbi:MAG: Na+/H+ antiporter NhaC [Bacteroidales bacterium]|nr:Na+/H+ antiporter NhaC [Bacteroidales bacterium]